MNSTSEGHADEPNAPGWLGRLYDSGPPARDFAKPSVILVFAVISFLASAYFGIHLALDKLLVQRAQTTGVKLAQHIEKELAGKFDAEPLRQPAALQKLEEHVGTSLEIGQVFQLDLINPGLYLESRFGGSPGRHPGQPVEQTGRSVPQIPLDRKLLRAIAEKGENRIRVHYHGNGGHRGTYAEIHYPVTSEGKLSYMLRLLVDLEEDANRFNSVLYSGAAFVLAMLFASFGYPMSLYFKILRKRNSADERAYFLANYDVLTNIRNRNAFQDHAPEILKTCFEQNQSAVLILFDLNNFKEINDYHGHLAGDQVLVAFADMLKENLPDNGYVARLGGDEFVIIVPGLENEFVPLEELLDIPCSVRTTLDQEKLTVEAGICGGYVRFPRDGETLDELLRNADLALYSAKEENNVSILEYNRHMGIDFYENLDLRDEFREALARSQIEPFYQPLVNLVDGRVEGFEALARWNHPKMGILTPISFGKLLDDPELGSMVGQQMLAKILADMKQWKDRCLSFGTIAINVGNGDLQRDGFALNIISELVKHGLSCEQFAIEVTENCLFGAYKEKFIGQLKDLRDAGCRISLDDFGTGYSSITQIKELPCTSVKIDKSFVKNVVNDEADQAIIRTLLELGRCIGFRVVAEGIETRMQLDFLEELGCEIAQGYYFSRPIPAAEVPELLRRLNGGNEQVDINSNVA